VTAAGPGTRVTVLGSGTLLPSASRRSAAHLVEIGDALVLLDVGFGTVHGFAEHDVPWQRLSHVVLSHFHTDHIGDLAPLLFVLTHGMEPEGRTAPLTLLGPPGLGEVLAGLARAHGAWVSDPPFPLRVHEMELRDGWSDAEERFELTCHPTTHTPEAVAWRVETPHGVVAYSGDTGPDEVLPGFLRGAHVLICECAVPDGSDVPIHLTPSQVADLAGVACPALLVLTHAYPPLVPAELPHLVRRAGYEGAVLAGYDGLRIDLVDGQPSTNADPDHRTPVKA
jgi:ribonuclease BN (tRNA processing enzyme)